MKKEIIDLAKQYITDMNGKTILNSGNLALRIDDNSYTCIRIDGTEWKFDHFRQACAFHYIASAVGVLDDDMLNYYYDVVKYNIGKWSKEEIQLQQKLL